MLPEKDLENLNNERIEEENAMDADSYIEALKKMKQQCQKMNTTDLK